MSDGCRSRIVAELDDGSPAREPIDGFLVQRAYGDGVGSNRAARGGAQPAGGVDRNAV